MDVDAVAATGARPAFVVVHDPSQYFGGSFAITSAGAIPMSDATHPKPARIAALEEEVAAEGVACVPAEPQLDFALVHALSDGLGMRSAVLDPPMSGSGPVRGSTGFSFANMRRRWRAACGPEATSRRPT